MLLANYASDSESGSDNDSGPSRPAPKAPAAPASAASSSKVKRKAPVKITLDLPKSSTPGAGTRDDDDADDKTGGAGEADAGAPDAKKPKLGGLKGGKGSSSLLGMLPPPKRKPPAPSIAKGSSLSVNKFMARPTISVPKPAANLPAPPGRANDPDSDDDDEADGGSGMLLPPSLQRKSAKGKEPSLDLFGLAPDPAASSSKSRITAASPPSSMSISSAPTVADFVPPEPTPNDPYPGYYQLPSGEWAAYEPGYYHSFFPDAEAVEETQARGDGRVGRHWDEFNSKGADFIDINVSKNLEEARAEKERRERTVKPKMPSDEIEYKAVGQIKGLATQKHQLSSLLNTAFTQKEELETRIASNKKNMRVAGQKYGF